MGVARVLQSASALRRARGLVGQVKTYDQSYAYRKKRRQWIHSQSYRHQKLPIGSGMTEAACKLVFTQRLKRSGMLWTIAGGQVILDLRVIWLSGAWEDVHQRYLMSKPVPVAQVGKEKGSQRVQMAA